LGWAGIKPTRKERIDPGPVSHPDGDIADRPWVVKKVPKRQPTSNGAPNRPAGAGSGWTSDTLFAHIFPDFLGVFTPLRMIVHISPLMDEPRAGGRRANRLAGKHITVSMKIIILVLSFLLGTCAFAAKVGDTYDQVLVEKGKPAGQITAGNSRILTYVDVSIRLRDNVVVEIKPIETPVGGGRRPGASAAGFEWITDYSRALTRARAERRNVFLFFTGSDWCGWCKRLEEEILTKSEFKNYAKEKLILVKLDFPRQIEQSEALQNQNRTLAAQYGIKGYPTVIVLDPAGRAVKQLGYQEGGPGPFVSALRAVEPRVK
jgi:thioredoxin-related protein